MTSPTLRLASAYVPHDIKAPIAGAGSGPLAGLTVGIKDMYDIAGERTGGGNPDWLAAQEPAKQHAVAVARLLGAGATITAKTVCDEFFYSVAGVNAHYGTPLNPRAPGRIPGGSSSGSASAVAASACDIGLGSDTGGSIRVPAAFNGLYGIRPTHGRIDATGAMDMAPSFDCVGWMAASPGLFARIGAVLLGGGARSAPIKRVLVAEDAFAEADAPVGRLLRAVLAAMSTLPTPEPVMLGGKDGLDARREIFRLIQAHETWATFGPFIEAHAPKFGPGVKERFAAARAVTTEDADRARAERARITAELDRLIAPGSIVALPTAPCIAPLVDAPQTDHEHYRLRVMRLTCTAGLGGLPQITLPVGLVDGCPVGLSFVGWRGADETLLDLAVRLGRHCGAMI